MAINRREQIRLTPDEQAAFFRERKKCALATIDRDGYPHVVAMNYFARDGAFYMTSYGKAQKVVNIRRNPRVALLMEAGDDYAELRGVMLRCDVTIHRDVDVVIDFAMELVERYSGGADGARVAFRKQAPKRVALEFVERDRVTWDHRKLAGTY